MRKICKMRRILLAHAFCFLCSFSGVVSAYEGERCAVPVGKSIGITLSTDGVMIVNTAKIDAEGKSVSPAEAAGLKSGDLITEYNSSEISNVEELLLAIEKSGGGEVPITSVRGGKLRETLILPQLDSVSGKYKIGAWIKDAASGIGTMTCYLPGERRFFALGHGICDTDSKELLPIDGGNVYRSTIAAVEKGEKGAPGELKGVFSDGDSVLGTIEKNSHCGVMGRLSDDAVIDGEPLEIAKRSEVKTGKAFVMANVEGEGTRTFSVEILRVIPQSTEDAKSMVIKVTDPDLIKKTGGIVQGMSGSPIIQNGKLIGAVTHVFVNDPTRGYGIFIENMLDEAA